MIRKFLRPLLFSAFPVLFIFSVQLSSAQSLTGYVDPLVGSGGHGHVFVGASVPFGAVQAGPNEFFKGWDWCSGYHYGDSMIVGFAQTHLSGTGIGDLGDIPIMPYTGAVKTDKGTETKPGSGYASGFSHRNELVRPGYYSVKLDNGVAVELTASERVAYQRYHFPGSKTARIIVDLKEGAGNKTLDAHIEQTDGHTLTGYREVTGWAKRRKLFFAIKVSATGGAFAVYNESTLLAGKSGSGKAIKGLLTYSGFSGDIELKIGISPVSTAGALANIAKEIPGWNFDGIVKTADKKWNDELSKISIETKNDTDRRIFYTALFHTMIDPALFNDADGNYMGADRKVHHGDFNNYSELSLWDTYRALNPLFTVFQPGRENDIIRTALGIYQQQGSLPVWHLQGNETHTMPGESAVQIVAEGYLKGISNYDTALALAAVKATMMGKGHGLAFDQKLTWIPRDSLDESVAEALEFGVSSASVALMEKKAGHKADAEYFEKRARNYQLYFDPAVGFMRGKKADGSWNPVFIPAKASHPYIDDYSEGNAWQYLWLVPGNVEGLISLLGGDERFNSKLDSLFTVVSPPDPNAPPDIAGLIGQYAHGDEPSHHTIYLSAYSGQQWKVAERTRQVLYDFYKDKPDEGMSGNDDCGQMSAWYVLSSMGFYPVFPANGAFVFGSPLFDRVAVRVNGGKTFTVLAENNNAENKYIQSATWNGEPYTKTYISYNEIMSGGELKFVMGPKPNEQYGAAAADRPKSVYN